MYALVKIRREQLLSKSIELPIAFIDEENGIVNNNLCLKNELKNYPEIDYIEDVFFMELKGENNERFVEVPKESILLYIGKGAENQEEWHVYNCNKKTIEKAIKDVPRYRIDTANNQIDSLQYLECIIDMISEAKKKDKRLIIFTEIEIKNVNYQYRSLLDKIINNLLVPVEGIYIHKCNEVIKDYYTPTHQRFEPYINQAIYTKDTLEESLKKIGFLIKDNVSSFVIRKEYRRVSKIQNTSYENVLDENIDLLNNKIAPQYTPQNFTYPKPKTYEMSLHQQLVHRKEQTYNSKLSPQLQLMLAYQNLIFPISFVQTTGIRSREIWEVLITYTGDISYIPKELYIDLTIIDEMFAIVVINKDNIVELSEYPNIQYVELPEVMQYIINQELNTICATGVTGSTGLFDLTGKGTLLGIIDSGIDYTHPDFIKQDGTSRILYLWDQTIAGNPPEGFKVGTVYTNEQINEALKAPTEEERLKIVPSQDTIGHGTAVAGVAGGNGSLSSGKYVGVAPESEFIVVKVGQEGGSPVTVPFRGPRNIETMLAIKYVLKKAIEVDKPVSMIIGFGINEGAHDGTSALEIAIDRASSVWKNNIVVGVGNQANKDSHTQGKVGQDEVKAVQIFVDQNQDYYYATLWKNFADNFGIVIEAPNGERTELLTRMINNRAFIFGNTVIMINFSEPSSANQDEQILLILDSFDGTTINSGIWKIYIIGLSILEGNYNIWGEAVDPVNRTTRFLEPSKEITLTIPSTSNRVTSVAASDKQGAQIAAFSGRGFTRTGKIKPDITAPGVDVVTASANPQNRYEPVTGTSIAGAFVAGAYALLMQYGIVEGRDENLYGERLKAYVLRNARRIPREEPYPNSEWGYGELCVRNALNELREKYSSGS